MAEQRTSPTSPGPPEAAPLRRCRNDRIVGGVCGGIARYLDVDPVLLRIVVVALALSGGAGVLAYIAAWIVIPEAEADEPERPVAATWRHALTIAVCAALVGIEGLLLLREGLASFGVEVFWTLVVASAVTVLLMPARR